MNTAATHRTDVRPVLEITRSFDAAPVRVYDAWLVREQWQSWIGPEGVQCEVPRLEPQVGGQYRIIMKMSDGSTIPVAGEFRVLDRPHKFVFTWGWEGDDPRNSLVTVTLKEVNGKTELTLRQENLPDEASRIAHGKGWNSTLNKLATYVKGQ